MNEHHNANLDRISDIQDLLDEALWEYDRANVNPVMAGGYIHSMVCEARYRGGTHLVVHVNVDRGAYSILVGTGQPDDMYPFEDVAVLFGSSSFQRLLDLIKMDTVRPLMSVQQARQFLDAHAGRLDAGFGPGIRNLRDELRKIARRFHNAAWNDATANP